MIYAINIQPISSVILYIFYILYEIIKAIIIKNNNMYTVTSLDLFSITINIMNKILHLTIVIFRDCALFVTEHGKSGFFANVEREFYDPIILSKDY